ncbi:MAG: hypothetical protein AAGF77_02565 [Bacteroidota bacterium]
MLKTIDRIMQFIEHSGLSARKFDMSIGAGNGYTLRMKKNNASVGSDVIETIIRTYPQLNLVWLMTGEGEMLNPQTGMLRKRYLPDSQIREIEQIIELKLRERHEREMREIKEVVTEEIIKRNNNK